MGETWKFSSSESSRSNSDTLARLKLFNKTFSSSSLCPSSCLLPSSFEVACLILFLISSWKASCRAMLCDTYLCSLPLLLFTELR